MEIHLNPQQEKAVYTQSKYVRVVAGAGSGKTRVLTMRVAHLIDDLGVEAGHIAAITFTNKAAKEMRDRIQQTVTSQRIYLGHPQVSTIHSLCVRILREDIHVRHYPSTFTVLDDADQKSIIREAYKRIDIDKNKYSSSILLNYISERKGHGITPQEALDDSYGEEEKKALVYQYYANRLQELKALDFDDLLLWTVDILKTNPDVRVKWQKQFQYILVDEFQDIDTVQYQLIKLLAGKDNELYVVGDPDQTIYTWRGADVSIIMHFTDDFKPCQTITLAENYRSTPMILNAANSVIVNNHDRLEKQLYTKRPSGEKIVHYSAYDDDDEAAWIAGEIRDLKSHGTSYSDIAILYRANYLSRALEKGLREAQIPYLIYGGLRFFDRAEIKDMLSYLRMLVSMDDLSLRRIINVPRRGIGDTTLDRLFATAQQRGTTMYEAIDFADVSASAKKKLTGFRDMIEQLKTSAENQPMDELLHTIFINTGYKSMLEEEKADEKIANVEELINDMHQYADDHPDADLAMYLQEVNLYTDQDEQQNTEYVQLMTVHAAKGLEFKDVFVAGMSQNIFPSKRSLADGEKGLEEERRLAYVAYTRASDRLFITENAGFSYVTQSPKAPSQFIAEIDPEYIDNIGRTKSFYYQPNKPSPARIQPDIRSQIVIATDKPQTTNPATQRGRYHNGDKVVHTAFGSGIVVKVDRAHNIVDVAFKNGIQHISMNFPGLKKED